MADLDPCEEIDVTNRTCDVEGCEKPVVKRKWCSAHYQRWRKYGDPLILKHVPREDCRVEGCLKPVLARNLCAMHYYRERKFGDPLIVTQIQGDDVARFWSYVDRRGPDECWPWTGGLTPAGYGQFLYFGVHGLAHRASYEFLVGPIPDGLAIDHTCHNGTGCLMDDLCEHRRCVNPSHLEPTSLGENILRGYSPAAINARKTHCIHGHPFDEANTYITPRGQRACKACARERARRPKDAAA